MGIRLLKFSIKCGAMMFGRSVEGYQVVVIFQQVWCYDV